MIAAYPDEQIISEKLDSKVSEKHHSWTFLGKNFPSDWYPHYQVQMVHVTQQLYIFITELVLVDRQMQSDYNVSGWAKFWEKPRL